MKIFPVPKSPPENFTTLKVLFFLTSFFKTKEKHPVQLLKCLVDVKCFCLFTLSFQVNGTVIEFSPTS